MKKGRWRDAKVLCPFYKYQSSQVIFCEGIYPESSVHQSFNNAQKKEYETAFCKNRYLECWICKEHMKLYEESCNETE